jgi:hypothetical protein
MRRSAESSVGEVFGRLTVTRVFRDDKNKAKVDATCQCGNQWQGLLASLRNSSTTSCGCAQREALQRTARKHGHANKHPLYNTWISMKQRCYNPDNPSHRYYGARGITVCDRWKASFEAFISDLGPRPDGTSLDRIDVNGNYEPGNCRWATPKEQANNKTDNRTVSYRGLTTNLKSLCEYVNVKYDLVRERLNAGWSIDDAINQPVHRLITYNGESRTLAEWGEILGISYGTLYDRHRKGLTGASLFHLGRVNFHLQPD